MILRPLTFTVILLVASTTVAGCAKKQAAENPSVVAQPTKIAQKVQPLEPTFRPKQGAVVSNQTTSANTAVPITIPPL